MPLLLEKQKVTYMPNTYYESRTLLGAANGDFCSESDGESLDDGELDIDAEIQLPVERISTAKPHRRRFHARAQRFLRRSLRVAFCIMLLPFFVYVFLSGYTSVPTRSAGISDWSANKSLNIADYVRPMEDTTLRAPRGMCNQNFFLIIVVSSSIENSSQRQTIRETWGNTTKFGYAEFASLHAHMHGLYLGPEKRRLQQFNDFLFYGNASQEILGSIPVRIVFLLGRQPQNSVNINETSARLISEAQQYNDIIQEDFVDSYNNLTVKSLIGMKYIIKNCQERSLFYMKCDDDTFVNVPNLLHILLGGTIPIYNQTLDLFDAVSYQVLDETNRLNYDSELLLGHAFCGAHPISDMKSKWYMPYYMYPGTVYPKYLSGAAYVIAMDAVQRLYETALNTSLIYMEDVYLTGICAEAAHLPRQNHPLFSYMRSRQWCAYKGTINQHNLNESAMFKAWQFVSNFSIKCPAPPDNRHYRLTRLRKRSNC